MASLKQTFYKYWYQYLSEQATQEAVKDTPVTFFNFGYWPPEGETLALLPEDEPNRHPIQLYHRVSSGWDLTGKKVLEVSCGHGGGASFVMRYHNPAAYTAIDQNPKAIAFCRQAYPKLGIDFQIGDAQTLAFPAASFDAVLNVEASHCYPRQDVFFRAVHRVLRPGGHFLYADFRPHSEETRLDQDLANTPFQIISKAEITDHVVRALKRTSEHYQEIIHRHIPKLLHPIMKKFAAVEGSSTYNNFARRAKVYLVYDLLKA